MNYCSQNQIYPSSEIGLEKYIMCFLKPPYIAQSNLFFLRKSDCQCRVYQRRIKKNKFKRSPLKVALHGITYIKMIGRGLKTTFFKSCFTSYHSSPPTYPSVYRLSFRFSPYNFIHYLLNFLICNKKCNCNNKKQYNEMLQKFAYPI